MIVRKHTSKYLFVLYSRFQDLLDNNSSPYFSYLSAGRWLAVRLDVLTIATTVLTAAFVVCATVYPHAFGRIPPAQAGLALSYAITVNLQFENVTNVL